MTHQPPQEFFYPVKYASTNIFLYTCAFSCDKNGNVAQAYICTHSEQKRVQKS